MGRDEAVRVGLGGLGEAARVLVADRFRAMGGEFARPDVGLFRRAMRDVRRGLEVRGRWADAEAITRREDLLEMRSPR